MIARGGADTYLGGWPRKIGKRNQIERDGKGRAMKSTIFIQDEMNGKIVERESSRHGVGKRKWRKRSLVNGN